MVKPILTQVQDDRIIDSCGQSLKNSNETTFQVERVEVTRIVKSLKRVLSRACRL